MDCQLTVTTDASFRSDSAGLGVVIHAFGPQPWPGADSWRHLAHIVLAKKHIPCTACTDAEELAFLFATRIIQDAFGFNRDVRVCGIEFTTDSQFVRNSSCNTNTSVDRALNHLALYFRIARQDVNLIWQPRSDDAVRSADSLARNARTTLPLHGEDQNWYHIRDETNFYCFSEMD